jgi:hypothetical protein
MTFADVFSDVFFWCISVPGLLRRRYRSLSLVG